MVSETNRINRDRCGSFHSPHPTCCCIFRLFPLEPRSEPCRVLLTTHYFTTYSLCTNAPSVNSAGGATMTLAPADRPAVMLRKVAMVADGGFSGCFRDAPPPQKTMALPSHSR